MAFNNMDDFYTSLYMLNSTEKVENVYQDIKGKILC